MCVGAVTLKSYPVQLLLLSQYNSQFIYNNDTTRSKVAHLANEGLQCNCSIFLGDVNCIDWHCHHHSDCTAFCAPSLGHCFTLLWTAKTETVKDPCLKKLVALCCGF